MAKVTRDVYQCSVCKKNKYDGDGTCPLDLSGTHGNSDILAGINLVIKTCGCGAFDDARGGRADTGTSKQKEYVITEEQIKALITIAEYNRDQATLYSLINNNALRSRQLSEEIKKARDAVLDEISKKLMDAMGIQNPPIQHYDPDDSFIPSLGADELADIIKSFRGEQT